jgi:hypothetical protein
VIGALVAAAVDPDAARDAAREILRDRRFHANPAPRPLRGPLQWIGDRLAPIGRWLGDVFSWMPAWVAWVLLVAGVAVVASLIVRAVRGRERRRAAMGPGAVVAPDVVENPDALEREANAAERAGEFERALRLRFRAGLLRLGQRGAIHYRSSVTTGEVRRALHSEQFDGLASTFERVTYGGDDASPPDVDTARREWPRVLENSRRG